MRRALRLAGLVLALSLWVIASSGQRRIPDARRWCLGFAGPHAAVVAGRGLDPHDADAWTEGLVIDGLGRLFESTGIVGHYLGPEVDRATGECYGSRSRRTPCTARVLPSRTAASSS
ncbi:MAG: glutaminyl-peptide cyclotransferase [Chloroflexota bacterium]